MNSTGDVFVPEEDDEENVTPKQESVQGDTKENPTSTAVDDGQATQASTSNQNTEPERRFVETRWLCIDPEGNFLEYIDDEWYPVENEDVEELKKKWEAAPPAPKPEAYRCEVNGVKMIWCPSTQQWIPDVEVCFLEKNFLLPI